MKPPRIGRKVMILESIFGICTMNSPFRAPAWLSVLFPGARIDPVTDGWSDDRKFRLEHGDEVLLVRVSSSALAARKKREIEEVRRLNGVTPALPEAIGHGLVPEQDLCYVVYRWVTGEPARPLLGSLPEHDALRLGIEAGQTLALIHSLPQQDHHDSLETLRRKIAHRARRMEEEGLRFPGYEAMLTCLEQNLHRVAGTPTRFRHGDYHTGNMLIAPDGSLRVIDLNRSDFGDPIEDFNRLFTISCRTSAAFACGQIRGYFGGEPPPTFFAHALCYVLIDCAFGMLWSVKFGEAEIEFQRRLVAGVMEDFDNLRAPAPRWFT